jgi:hypothetical protein
MILVLAGDANDPRGADQQIEADLVDGRAIGIGVELSIEMRRNMRAAGENLRGAPSFSCVAAARAGSPADRPTDSAASCARAQPKDRRFSSFTTFKTGIEAAGLDRVGRYRMTTAQVHIQKRRLR